jgi:hypothetical protein
MNVPYELLWGVDVAIKKLRPNANFQLEGNKFTIWNDPVDNTKPPTWEEVMTQMEEDKKRAEEWLKNNQ